MFILSAFADEISSDPTVQCQILKNCNIKHIEFRSIHHVNVLKLTDSQIDEFERLLNGEGFQLSAIASPLGKVPIDTPFEAQLSLFERAVELAHRFQCPRIRLFSYYPPSGMQMPFDWQPYRHAVLDRLCDLAERAETCGVTLLHENEHGIYGDQPERVADLLSSVNRPSLRAAYDAANWVFCGFDPVHGWELTKEFTTHFHIKDWMSRDRGHEQTYGVMPGTGDGMLQSSLRDAILRGYNGFAVMEPHLRGGGPTGGKTGPDLFPYAVQAFRELLQKCGGTESS